MTLASSDKTISSYLRAPVESLVLADTSAPDVPVRDGAIVSYHRNRVRCGQVIHPSGGDLVLTAPVNDGAEIIADGSVFVHGPLCGAALAGASGALDAQIVCTQFYGGLISIAGVYFVFDEGHQDLMGKSLQFWLNPERQICVGPWKG